jgi:hypothetical protein
MDPTTNPALPNTSLNKPYMFTSADMNASSEPPAKQTASVRYSKYDLANPDLEEGVSPVNSHLPTVYPGTTDNTEGVDNQDVPTEAPSSPASIPSDSNSTRKILIFSGIVILALALLISGGFLIYSLTRPAETVITPTVSNPNTESNISEQSETDSATSTVVTPIEEAPAVSVEEEAPVVQAPAIAATPTVLRQAAGSENNNQVSEQPLPKAGPSIGSILANLALSILIFSIAKKSIRVLSKIQIKR